MLQLGGTLARMTPRGTWWAAGQHLLAASSSSTAANPSPEVDNAKDENVENILAQNTPQTSNKKVHKSKSLVTATFKSLAISEDDPIVPAKNKELNDRIHAASSIDEILNVSNDPNFNQQNAATTMRVLYNWVNSSKININELQNNKKYWKVYNMLGIDRRTRLSTDSDDPLKLFQSDQEVEKIKGLNVHQLIMVLTKLASKQQRQTPLLHAITNKITVSNESFNIKVLGDILYSMAVLTFYNETLIQKISKNLLEVIPANKNSAVIGSILRSIGILRYRDETLLDSLSNWIVQNNDIIRPQEINSLLMALAHLGYAPKNMSELLTRVISPLKESDMCNSNEWLDVIWALTILNYTVEEQYESVLNQGFLNRLFDVSEYSIPKSLKVLNINAAARLLPNYKGPLLPEDSHLFEISIPRTKEKVDLSNSIISALKILAPSDSIYLNIYVNTKMGFLLDAEFCVNSKCTPLPLNNMNSNKQEEVLRIAVITCSYHDFCRGVTEVIGPIKFYRKLLEQQNYKTMLIPYTDVNIKDKLIQRVQYINNNIKKLVAEVSKK